MGRSCDFIVESNGLCFICLKRSKISLQARDYLLKEKSDNEDFPNFVIYNLQSLSHFLRIDMKKVFRKEEDISKHLLDKVIQSTLKAKLCDQCSILMQKFSKLNQQLEKIRLEVISSLRNIHEKFLDAKEEADELNDMAQSQEYLYNGWLDKLDILKILRSQAIDKSSRLISSASPRIKIENLTMTEVQLLKRKLRQSSRAPPPISSTYMGTSSDIHLESIKDECPSRTSESEDRDDHSNYSDDFRIDNDDATASEINEEEQNVSETKVDVNSPGMDDLPTAREPHFVKVNNKYQCNLCKKLYDTKYKTTRHYNSIHLKLRHNCNICGKGFTTRHSYKCHYQAIHLGDADFRCSKCNRTFTEKQSLRRHLLLQSCAGPMPLKLHKCNLCAKSYSWVYQLKGHVKTAHWKSSRHECNLCAKIFTKGSSLKTHIDLVHKGLRKHRCNDCGKRYSVKSGLTFHKATAHGHKPDRK